MISLGRNLREARESQSLSLRQTAGRAGISAAYLSRIESGKVKAPKPETIKAIARVLGLDMDGIFRLSASLDPELSGLLESNPEVIQLLRLIAANKLNKMEIELIRMFVRQYVLPRR